MNTVSCKATLKNFGYGILELEKDEITFRVEKGFFKKKQEILREIKLNDIKNVELIENELSIRWVLKENEKVTDVFLADETEQIKLIYDKITETLNEQKKLFKGKDEATQKSKEIKKVLNHTLEVVDALFNMLRRLHGRVDWNQLEICINRIAEDAKMLNAQIQKLPPTNLDLTALSSAVKERLPDQISQETYNLLYAVHKYFEELVSVEDNFLKTVHPNFYDAKNILLAYYTLNDIILGIIVEDKEIEKENQEFTQALNNLSQSTNLRIEVDEINKILNRLNVESEKETVIKEVKSAYRRQLSELITPPS